MSTTQAEWVFRGSTISYYFFWNTTVSQALPFVRQPRSKAGNRVDLNN